MLLCNYNQEKILALIYAEFIFNHKECKQTKVDNQNFVL